MAFQYIYGYKLIKETIYFIRVHMGGDEIWRKGNRIQITRLEDNTKLMIRYGTKLFL